MGLLSDPEYGSLKWVKILRKVHGPLSVMCYIGAVVWFVMLGNRAFNNETYFSENALLPGLVTNMFNGEQSAKQIYNEFNQELEDKYEDSDVMPIPWLVGKMSQLNLEVYTHNFTLNYPLVKGQIFKGTNVYGILRAPRTPSLEAIVVSAPYRSLSSHQKGTTAGIALMMSFAKFARSQKYWAKDIIFLVTEHEQLGMQAWLEAYHGIVSRTDTFYSSLGSFWKPEVAPFDFTNMGFMGFESHKKCLDPGQLQGRSGSIQAAINLEFHVPKIKYIEVKVEGLNGQLPNLDLVNLVHKLCVKSGIHHSYKNSYSWMRTQNEMDDWKNSVKTMLGMVTTQLAGVPNGNHGLFHRFGIESVTLEGRDANDPSGIAPKVNALSPSNFFRLGVALESILRSLNNLLERFHQSYFFYVLAGTNRFVSIGQYMPCLCLLCVALLIRALAFWVNIQADNESSKQSDKSSKQSDKTSNPSDKSIEQSDKESKQLDKESKQLDKESKQSNKESKEKTTLLPGEQKEQGVKKRKNKSKKVTNDEPNTNYVSIGANYLLVHLLGYAVMNSPVIFSHLGSKFYNQQTEISVFYGLAITSIILTIISPFLLKLIHKGTTTHEEVTLVNVLLLIELATVCMAVGMHNFPLGLCMAALYTPVALVVCVFDEDSGSLFVQYLKRIFCLLLHPLSAITIGMILYSSQMFPEDNFMTMLSRGRDAAMQAITFSIVDSLIYGNWLFNVACSLILPIWILFWQILNVRLTKISYS